MLGGGGGLIVVMECGFCDRIAPQVLHAFVEDRAVVTLSAATDPNGDFLGQRRHELLEQLRGLVQRRPLAAMPCMARLHVSGHVTIEPLALLRLRLAHERPYLTQSRTVQRPKPRCVSSTLWCGILGLPATPSSC